MAQRPHALLVQASICCCLAITATGRHLTQTSSSTSECYQGIADKQTNAADCVWVTSGVSSAACSARAAGQADQSNIYDAVNSLCTVPMPYNCSALGAATSSNPTKCSDAIGNAVVALLSKSAQSGTINSILSTNGNTLSKGGSMTSAAGTHISLKTGTSSSSTPTSTSTPSTPRTSTPSTPSATPVPTVVNTPGGGRTPTTVNPNTGSVPGLQVPAWG